MFYHEPPDGTPIEVGGQHGGADRLFSGFLVKCQRHRSLQTVNISLCQRERIKLLSVNEKLSSAPKDLPAAVLNYFNRRGFR